MIRHFDGELSTWGGYGYIKEIRRISIRNSHDDNISKANQGGFLVPRYIKVEKSGFMNWLFRFIGRIMKRESIYLKGIEEIDFHKFLKDGKTRIRKCKVKIS